MTATGYVAGGYFLTRRVRRDDRYMASDLLPPAFVSLSGCLADFAFDLWWDRHNVAGAAGFGVHARRFPELIAWYRERLGDQLGVPNVAYSTAVIEDFVQQFRPDLDDDVVVVGCAVAPEHRDRLIEAHRGRADDEVSGVVAMLERNAPLEPGGTVLGFEPVSYQRAIECSWLCNSLERVVEAALGIRPDADTGLLSAVDDAVRVVEHISLDDVGAEPGTWLPWLVVGYPLHRSGREVPMTAGR